MQKIDVAIIGGGAIGLSIGRSLSKAGKMCVVLEKGAQIGMETSSRSSSVLHAGIYNSKASLKTKFCIEGKQKLLQYMKDRNIPHNICGKLIVSTTPDENNALMKIYHNAKENGLTDLEIIDAKTAHAMEPEVTCSLALLSPNTGIFDSTAVMQHFEYDILSQGSEVITDCEFLAAKPISADHLLLGDTASTVQEGGYLVTTNRGDFLATHLVNSAGLWANQVSHRIASLRPESIPLLQYVKGNYWSIRGRAVQDMPFHRLVYPIPVRGQGGLGIHATLDLQGRVRFGPDTEWLPDTSALLLQTEDRTEGRRGDRLLLPWDYTVSEDSAGRQKAKFVEAIACYWPAVRDCELAGDYAGVRPKAVLRGTGTGAGTGVGVDFVLHTEAEHGARNVVALYGIESPGWTSSLAIADHVTHSLTPTTSTSTLTTLP